MIQSKRNTWLTAAVVLLLLANVASIAIFWLGRNRQHGSPEQPASFLVRELGFDTRQQDQFMQLVTAHRQRAGQLREQVKDAKDEFFGLLQQPNVPDSIKTAAAAKASQLTQQLDLVTFEHFQQVRSLCNASQQKKFDAIIHDVLRNMGGPGGPPPPGGDHHGPPPRRE
jgi:hypothetical protein